MQKETKKEKLRRALSEQRQGLPISNKDVQLFVQERDVAVDSNDDDNSEKESGMDETPEVMISKETLPKQTEKSLAPAEVVVGSALKRSASGQPLLITRKKRRK